MDTMTFTKVLGGLCGALLIYLLGAWGAEILYHGGGGHGDHHEQAYVIPVEGADTGEEVVEVAFADVFAAADSSKGDKLWRKCSACHKLEDGANGTGPHLFNVVSRDIATVDGFNYSGALTGLEGAWTPEALNEFLENPKAYAPGTAMSYNGMAKIEDRANLIAYLQGNGS